MGSEYGPARSSYLVCQTPHDGASNEHALRSQGQRLQDIAPCPYPPIYIHLDPTLHGVHNLRQSINLWTQVLSRFRVTEKAITYCTLYLYYSIGGTDVLILGCCADLTPGR